MQTHELLDILCNDRLSKHSNRIDASSLAAVLVLLLVSLYLFEVRDLTRLNTLLNTSYFQYLMCCLLIVYIAAAKLLLKLSQPGHGTGLVETGLVLGLLLLWLPKVQVFQPFFSQFGFQLLPLTDWLTHTLKLVIFALPWLGLFLLYLRHMAPTRLTMTCAMAGLVACTLTGALDLLNAQASNLNFYIYSNTAGMVLVALIGAVLGPRIVRW